ncbi:hypothetical protein [Actinoplanes sp. NPDC020271]|uniref:hypothetical protein n=1 Tax=Actinoplanes sp. NPDC020271 TaxID=3363896 RepID=UPI00379957A3
MPEFSIHPNLDDLARRNIAAALARPSSTDAGPAQPGATDTGHHGAHQDARDTRQDARRSSGRTRSGRAAAAQSSRTYAFRRS